MLSNVLTARKLTSQHPLFALTKDVLEICQPFFQQHEIKSFFYGRIDNDGKAYGLISNSALIKLLFDKQLLIFPYAPNKLLNDKEFYFLGNHSLCKSNEKIFSYARILFDLDHPIHFIESHIGYVETYSFAVSSSRSDAVNFYLNNIELF